MGVGYHIYLEITSQTLRLKIQPDLVEGWVAFAKL
jgi:hypothetical protein